MTPANDVGALLATVRVLLPKLTVVVVAALLKFETVRPLGAVAMLNTPDPLKLTPEEDEISPSLARRRVPAEIAVAPVYVDGPANSKIPVPDFVSPPLP
jgi:hypothetical protein